MGLEKRRMLHSIAPAILGDFEIDLFDSDIDAGEAEIYQAIQNAYSGVYSS